jgi:hypothetical protein
MDTETGEETTILESEKLLPREPRLSWDGRWLCFRLENDLYVARFRGKERIREGDWKKVATSATMPVWSPNGNHLYFISLKSFSLLGNLQAGSLMRQSFDPVKGEAVGTAERFYDLSERLLGNAISNQTIGSVNGIVIGFVEPSNDIWVMEAGK